MDSVKSVLRIIEAVATSPEIGVSDLSRQLRQPKTTVQRGLMTLHEAGWIRPTNEPRRRWKITSKLFMLSRSAETEARLRRAALPVMQTLRDETQETTHLMVREERHLVLIERVDSPLALRTVRDLGSRSPLHTSANGKAYLAYLTAREQEDYLTGKLSQLTENSKTDPGRHPQGHRADQEARLRDQHRRARPARSRCRSAGDEPGRPPDRCDVDLVPGVAPAARQDAVLWREGRRRRARVEQRLAG